MYKRKAIIITNKVPNTIHIIKVCKGLPWSCQTEWLPGVQEISFGVHDENLELRGQEIDTQVHSC